MGAAVEADAVTASLFGSQRALVYRTTADGSHLDRLIGVETEAIAPMAPRRAAEFAAGRACAHDALAALGHDGAIAIERGELGAPVWPDGVTGSITHTRGFCMAVVAERAGGTVGLDAEELARVPQAIARRVLTGSERRALEQRSPEDAQRLLATAFAAKEAFYKAHFQREPRYLGFDVVEVDVGDTGALTFRTGVGSAVAPTVVEAISARWRIESGRVIVAVRIDP